MQGLIEERIEAILDFTALVHATLEKGERRLPSSIAAQAICGNAGLGYSAGDTATLTMLRIGEEVVKIMDGSQRQSFGLDSRAMYHTVMAEICNEADEAWCEQHSSDGLPHGKHCPTCGSEGYSALSARQDEIEASALRELR